MFLPRRQDAADIQVAHVDGLVLILLALLLAAFQDLHVDIRVHGQEEGKRVPLLAGLVADSVYGGGEEPVGLALEVLAYVADERALLRRRVDPLAGLVEHFQCLDFVLADEREPYPSPVSSPSWPFLPSKRGYLQEKSE